MVHSQTRKTGRELTEVWVSGSNQQTVNLPFYDNGGSNPSASKWGSRQVAKVPRLSTAYTRVRISPTSKSGIAQLAEHQVLVLNVTRSIRVPAA